MTFIITCFFVALYFIRPFEILESMRGMPILLYVGIIAAVFLLKDIVSGKVKLFRNGTDQMMVGFYLAIGMSHINHFYFGGASKSMQDFFPVFIGYFLITHSITSINKLKFFLSLLVCCSTFLAFEGALEIRNGSSYFGVKPLEQVIGHNDNNEVITTSRIKWVGTFADPNDLAIAFVVIIPFLMDSILKRHYLIPLSLLSINVYGLFLTNSRGGMISLLAALSAYLVLRYRSFKGLVVGCCFALLLIVFGPSRLGNVSATEQSAHGRLDAWYSGYQMFKSAPIFGVGKGMFTDYHELTAHNSFVLVFSELGLFGTLFFVGLFYFPVTSAYKTVFCNNTETSNHALLNIYNAIWSSLIGLMASMFFLSRSYVLLPYIVIALSMSFANIPCNEVKFTNAFNGRLVLNFKYIAIISILGIVFINIMVKVLL